MNYYAGIGSRETPVELKDSIKIIVEHLNKKGYILRSGGANGADTFFEEHSTNSEIYLPWCGFNANKSRLCDPTSEAMILAQKYHPNWSRLGYGAKKMMARNCHQVLGQDLKTPVKFIVCWTKDGKVAGGTGQALRMANDLGIPVYNLFFKETLNKILTDI